MADLIRIEAIARKLGDVHPSYAWRKLASDSEAPKSIKLGARLTVFDEADVDRWIDGMVKAAIGKKAKVIRKAKALIAA